MAGYVVGIDLGATKIGMGLISPADEIIARERMPTAAWEGPGSVVTRIAEVIGRWRRELPSAEAIEAVGICTPGPVDHATGYVLDPPNLTGWRDVPLRDMLRQRLGIPVVLEHDAKAAALGEFHYGAGRGARSMVYIVVGTGVGAAVIVDGALYRGSHNSAGEVGHITLDRFGELCSCGNRGCVETFVSGPALARRYQTALDAAGQGLPPTPGEHITGEVVYEMACAGDPLARQVIEEAGNALGYAVATLAMILDIELYVVGSSVARCGDMLLEPARRAVSKGAFASVARRVRITTTSLWDDGPILGCGWLAKEVAAGAER